MEFPDKVAPRWKGKRFIEEQHAESLQTVIFLFLLSLSLSLPFPFPFPLPLPLPCLSLYLHPLLSAAANSGFRGEYCD